MAYELREIGNNFVPAKSYLCTNSGGTVVEQAGQYSISRTSTSNSIANSAAFALLKFDKPIKFKAADHVVKIAISGDSSAGIGPTDILAVPMGALTETLDVGVTRIFTYLQLYLVETKFDPDALTFTSAAALAASGSRYYLTGVGYTSAQFTGSINTTYRLSRATATSENPITCYGMIVSHRHELGAGAGAYSSKTNLIAAGAGWWRPGLEYGE